MIVLAFLAKTALALAVTVTPGQCLSVIAAQHGDSLATVELANPQIHDVNRIYVGEQVLVPVGGSYTPPDSYAPAPAATPVQAVPEQPAPQQAPITSVPSSGDGGGAIPTDGSYQARVALAESSDNAQVMNSSGHYGLYQFSVSTWTEAGGNPADFGHASVAEQNSVFDSAFAKWGSSPWQPSDHVVP